MPTTSNFGWTTPADTDLVKDGAAAIRTLGNGIDTSFLDLKGGTSGQVLSKNSNTDLDYTWVTPNVGDITEVQAGTGISVASGTGPIPIVTNTVATAFDAAGDLIYGTGADTFTKLSLGTAGKILAVNSGATAPEWITAAGSKVVQTVFASHATAASTSSSSWSDTGLTATITPTSASNKIIAFVHQNGVSKTGITGVGLRLLRGGTTIATFASAAGYDGGAGENQINSNSTVYEDSPATTSSTTYKTQFNSVDNIATAFVQVSSMRSGILLMEVTP